MTLLRLLFGCRHKRFTFPQTIGGVTHVACLDCGKRVGYDWKLMRRLDSRPGVLEVR